MKVSKVCCQGCGADLEVDVGIRYVSCNFCGARLEIVHDETVTHSRLLEKIGEQTEEMASDLKVIRLQNELARIDREWQQDYQGFLVRRKDGRMSEPNMAPSMVGAVVAVVFGIIWMAKASNLGAPPMFALFGLVFIGFALAGVATTQSKVSRMKDARKAYEHRRTGLLDEIRRAGGLPEEGQG